MPKSAVPDDYQWETCRIGKATLGMEDDHRFFGFVLMLDFGSSVQGYGWFVVSEVETIKRLLRFLGVDELHLAAGIVLEAGREEPYGFIKGLRRLPFDGGAIFSLEDPSA